MPFRCSTYRNRLGLCIKFQVSSSIFRPFCPRFTLKCHYAPSPPPLLIYIYILLIKFWLSFTSVNVRLSCCFRASLLWMLSTMLIIMDFLLIQLDRYYTRLACALIVKLVAGYNNDIPYSPPLPHNLFSYWMNKLINKWCPC